MDEWELYDLENDPKEMNNIYQNAPNSLIKNLKAQLKAQQRKLKDNGSLKQMKLMTDTVISRVYNEPNKVKNK